MLFNTPTLADQCSLAVGALVPKALNRVMGSDVPSGVGGLEQRRYLCVSPSTELLGSSSFPAAREKFCSWKGREEQWNSYCTLPPAYSQHVRLQQSPAAEVEKLRKHAWSSVGEGNRPKVVERWAVPGTEFIQGVSTE